MPLILLSMSNKLKLGVGGLKYLTALLFSKKKKRRRKKERILRKSELDDMDCGIEDWRFIIEDLRSGHENGVEKQ